MLLLLLLFKANEDQVAAYQRAFESDHQAQMANAKAMAEMEEAEKASAQKIAANKVVIFVYQ